MKRLSLATVLASLSSIAAFAAVSLVAGHLLATEPNPLDGRWDVTELSVDGTVVPVEGLPNKPWFDMKNDVWMFWLTHVSKPGQPTAAKFQASIDKTKSPWEVDAKLVRGTMKGQVCKGICEFDGQTIRLCLTDSPGTPRPTKFDSSPGTGVQMIVMKRADAPASLR
jgi:uncharacterized protein (TIGR03067 family)